MPCGGLAGVADTGSTASGRTTFHSQDRPKPSKKLAGGRNFISKNLLQAFSNLDLSNTANVDVS